jgi:hypothetical protein
MSRIFLNPRQKWIYLLDWAITAAFLIYGVALLRRNMDDVLYILYRFFIQGPLYQQLL